MTSPVGFSWPNGSDSEAWTTLANQVMQLAMLEADKLENDEWIVTMRSLISENLDHATFTERRMAALQDRLRQRKLVQMNLRYKYGLKHRRISLVRYDVKAYVRRAAASQ